MADSFDEVLTQDGEGYAALTFKSCLQHKFGYPNEEAIQGHPYFAFGIKVYACVEVAPSKWLNELEVQNRVHPYHQKNLFCPYRHFIFPFHDSTFECLAEKYLVRTYKAWGHQVVFERLKNFSGWLSKNKI